MDFRYTDALADSLKSGRDVNAPDAVCCACSCEWWMRGCGTLRVDGPHVQLGLIPLHRCCMTGNWDGVLLLLNSGRANVNLVDEVSPSCCRFLLKQARAVIRLWLQYGDTPLHYACYSGHTNIAKLLLQFGADPLVHGQVRHARVCLCFPL
jgi:ankyrin repeat protein